MLAAKLLSATKLCDEKLNWMLGLRGGSMWMACFQNNLIISGNTVCYSIGGTLHYMLEEECLGMVLGDITGENVISVV